MLGARGGADKPVRGSQILVEANQGADGILVDMGLDKREQRSS